MRNAYELNGKALELVNGGTFDRNTLEESRYNEAGIRTKYHLFEKDEFWLPGGIKTDMNGADEYVRNLVGEETYRKWVKEHELCELDAMA